MQTGTKDKHIGPSEYDLGLNDVQLERRRERNKNAAARCRAKARNRDSELSIKFARESSRHEYLKGQLLELRDSLTYLRTCALQHDSGGCRCNPLHEYNDAQAKIVHHRFSGAMVSVGEQ
jgi:hypothetical protein